MSRPAALQLGRLAVVVILGIALHAFFVDFDRAKMRIDELERKMDATLPLCDDDPLTTQFMCEDRDTEGGGDG